MEYICYFKNNDIFATVITIFQVNIASKSLTSVLSLEKGHFQNPSNTSTRTLGSVIIFREVWNLSNPHRSPESFELGT